MAVNNPIALKFINERVRTGCESLRALHAVFEDTQAAWVEIQKLVTDDDKDPVDDGRESEGVSRLTAKDIYRFMTVVNAVNTAFDADAPAITKPCVRPLTAS